MKLETIKLTAIKENFNPRSDFSGVDELAKSIESIGLLQPIVVHKADGNEPIFVLVDGACRLRALKKLGQKETQAFVFDGKAEEAQMAANLVRSDLNLIERARGYERMVRLFPAKYNAAGIAKMFGTPKATVERLISVAKRIDTKHDAKLGPCVTAGMDFREIELIAQVPPKFMDKVIEALNPKDARFYSAITKVAKSLDYSCDALTTGKLVSAGRAFVVKTGHGSENAYTFDEAAYKEAKDAYEKRNGEQYGKRDKENKAKVVEKSEKQKEADRAALKKEKDARIAAVKELAPLFKKFIGKAPSNDQVHKAAKEMFERHVDSDKCRRLWAAFGIEGCSKVSSYELRGKTYDKVIKPFIKNAHEAVMLLAFVEMGWKDGATPEQAWVAGMKK